MDEEVTFHDATPRIRAAMSDPVFAAQVALALEAMEEADRSHARIQATCARILGRADESDEP